MIYRNNEYNISVEADTPEQAQELMLKKIEKAEAKKAGFKSVNEWKDSLKQEETLTEEHIEETKIETETVEEPTIEDFYNPKITE